MALVAAWFVAAPGSAETLADWRPFVAEASARFGVPDAWIERVMQAESGGRTRLRGRPITSRAGAMGLMQLLPAAWAEMRAAYGLGSDPYDPHDNIIAGAAYLRAMYDRFGYPGLFAAYNAGPGRYADHLASGRALPRETRFYLVAVAGNGRPEPLRPSATRPPGIFVALGTSRQNTTATPVREPRSALFVALMRP